jgi:diguanylate cyclase (GGDEF)-like protein
MMRRDAMANTIFILGNDNQQCKELKEILQDRITDAIVTSSGDNLPSIQESDTVIITSEEKNTGVLYRRLLNKLEDQVHRARFLGELIRLFATSHQPQQVVEKVAVKSTEVLGETAFILLVNDANQLRLDAAHSQNPEALVKILMTAINAAPNGAPAEMLRDVIVGKTPKLIEHLQHLEMPNEIRALVEKYSFSSMIVVPIQTNEYVLGAFISIANAPRVFGEEDLKLAIELSDFASIALENASLFGELQRTAITDSLTGLYNTRFFNEVLSREASRADRYATPLSLLMVDVDSFKLVNDTYGHVVGNKVLTQIGKALQKSVRNTDFVFRCGGDEFGIVLPATTIEGALHAAEKILQKIEHADILAGLGYSGTVTVSIGVSEYRRGSHYESMVAEADQALYASKRFSKGGARTIGN